MQFRINFRNKRAKMELLGELAAVEIADGRRLDVSSVDLRVINRLLSRFGDEMAEGFTLLFHVALEDGTAAAENVNRFHSRSCLRLLKRGSRLDRETSREKLQAPNHKSQRSSNFQARKADIQLIVGAWNLVLLWSLVLGIWSLLPLLLPRIGFRDNQAHRVLIKSFKAAFALQFLQMTHDRPSAQNAFVGWG